MQKLRMSLGLIVLGAVAIGGCHKSEDSGAMSPTTMTAPPTNGVTSPTTLPVPPAGQTEIALPAVKPPATKDLTHVLIKDEPFYLNEPGATPVAVGTLKTGAKVLVLIPGFPYSQVMTETGITAYVMTEGLKPLGK
jgi:hypothetical protein